jgi:hypothetical protein
LQKPERKSKAVVRQRRKAIGSEVPERNDDSLVAEAGFLACWSFNIIFVGIMSSEL